MDPNTALADIRHTVKVIEDAIDTGRMEFLKVYAETLVLSVRDLDEWLAKGGFPPDAWKQS